LLAAQCTARAPLPEGAVYTVFQEREPPAGFAEASKRPPASAARQKFGPGHEIPVTESVPEMSVANHEPVPDLAGGQIRICPCVSPKAQNVVVGHDPSLRLGSPATVYVSSKTLQDMAPARGRTRVRITPPTTTQNALVQLTAFNVPDCHSQLAGRHLEPMSKTSGLQSALGLPGLTLIRRIPFPSVISMLASATQNFVPSQAMSLNSPRMVSFVSAQDLSPSAGFEDSHTWYPMAKHSRAVGQATEFTGWPKPNVAHFHAEAGPVGFLVERK